jgi:tRNA threonylcarbamoyladenosine biosynthesis protein TsaB
MAMSSLEMLAHAVQGIAAQQAAYICPLIDARRMEAYSQLFDQTISPQNKPEAILFEEKPFDALLKKEKVVFTGDGLEKAVPLLEGYSNAILLPQWPQGLAHVGLHLQRKFIQNDFEQLALFEPFYLKGVRITRSKKQQK